MHTRPLIPILAALLAFITAGPTAAQDADFLKPDEAFQIAGHAKGADSVVVEWRIADGYYLYRSK
ncbi:MAG: protein-disulfide reductase DsbD family protein, partial [Chromatiales bacterium]